MINVLHFVASASALCVLLLRFVIVIVSDCYFVKLLQSDGAHCIILWSDGNGVVIVS